VLQIPHIQRDFCSLVCCVLHRIAFPVMSEWYQNCPSFGLYGRGPEESKIQTVASLSPMQVGKYRGAGKGSAEPQSVGLSGRAAPLMPSVHDLGSEVAGVEVGHEATNLAALYLQNAHAVVGGVLAVRSTLRRPLESRPLLGGENVSELGPHLAEGTTVARPELAQAFVASEGTRGGTLLTSQSSV
jgi:hypothetical protein